MPTAIWLARARDRGGLDRLDGEAVAFVSEREELVQAVAALDERPWAAAEELVGRWLAGHPVHSSWLDVGLGPQIESARAEAKAVEWEALCVRAAGWVGQGPEMCRIEPPEEEAAIHRAMDILRPAQDRVTVGSMCNLALFARLMAIVSRPAPVSQETNL